MDQFDQAWAETGPRERGYSNHPNDPGGETMHGITVKVARRHGYTGPMRDLPAAEARRIAKVEYWDPLNLDLVAALSPKIARELFDTHFNLWSGAAATFLQRALNALNHQGQHYPEVTVDGVLGRRETIPALAAFLARRKPDGERVMLRCLNSQQCVDYMRQTVAQPGKEDFFFGWVLHRVRVDGDG